MNGDKHSRSLSNIKKTNPVPEEITFKILLNDWKGVS